MPTTRLLPILALALAACATEPLDEARRFSQEQLGFFADNLPEHLQTTLTPGGKGLHVDAGDKRRLFPMPRQVRQFVDHDELLGFAAETLGAEWIFDADGKLPGGFSIYTTQIGESFWIDEEKQRVYQVGDPALAWLGGTSGRVVVGGQSLCLDGRKKCDDGDGRASYLVPVGNARAADLDVCSEPIGLGGSFCAHFHSFFNKVDTGVVRYARHGGNTRLTRNDGGTFIHVGGVRVCSAGDPGAFDLGAIVSGGTRSFFVCLDFSLESLPPELREIRVLGPMLAGPFGLDVRCGPGSTTEGFTEVAVESVTWFGAGSPAMDAWMVCNEHAAGEFFESTGNGPRGGECPIFSDIFC